MTNHITFYEHKEKPWGVFSNFYPTKITIDDIEYKSSEHYFQSKKFEGPSSSKKEREYSEIIKKQNTAGKTAILARQIKPKQNYAWAKELWVIIQKYLQEGVKIREDWDEVKNNVMRRAVYSKFEQNKKLKEVLLSTGTKKIAEHTHRDSYWGDGCNPGSSHIGKGKSMLGKILEETRFIFDKKLISDRYSKMLPSKSKWVIHGLFVISDSSEEEIIEKGFKLVFSSKIQYGCLLKGSPKILLVNWQEDLEPENWKKIARVLSNAISKDIPVCISSRDKHIIDLVLECVYGKK